MRFLYLCTWACWDMSSLFGVGISNDNQQKSGCNSPHLLVGHEISHAKRRKQQNLHVEERRNVIFLCDLSG